MLWGSIVIGFVFLDRSSELWGPPTKNDHEMDVSHCVKAADVILRNKYGSHKGAQTRQGSTIRHSRSGLPNVYPVVAAELCLLTRKRWLSDGRPVGPYLISTSQSKTINKSTVTKTIKNAATALGSQPSNYSSHSLRIGGA
ncbi:Hypothetical protein PHPALM_3111 [Phytophthora palmivora]|uniref:Tyr recombinase domain-containing protein n=1 Tax=Phytophthora palmivora TaxID=4796 RepID=A0A2P4YN67_9STRA|nr:Hypothetical protein PHPALM_3111 [Phytophthora palmivora]